MQIALQPAQPMRREKLRFSLLFGASYPLFLVAEAAQRGFDRFSTDSEASTRSEKSVFAAARENASIAISYAFMARTTLQSFARHNRSERQS